LRLRWRYGDQLVWRTRLIALTLEPGETERLAEGAPNLQRIHGMPIDPVPSARPVSSEPACRAVVAARLHAPGTEEALLRRLRVRVMQRGLLDDPELIAAAARDIGLDPAQLAEWCARDDVEETYEAAIANLAPELVRRPKPESVEELLAWADAPLATAEVALVAQLALQKTRAALSRVATPLAAGADFYWELTESTP
jgi:hypothetical protein